MKYRVQFDLRDVVTIVEADSKDDAVKIISSVLPQFELYVAQEDVLYDTGYMFAVSVEEEE